MISGLIPMFLMMLIYGGMIALAVFLLILLSRLVKASERTADAVEQIARKLPDTSRP